MLTKNLVFGMNIVTLAGFGLMGVGLTLNRQQRIGALTAFAMMGVGTALAFLGLYIAVP